MNTTAATNIPIPPTSMMSATNHRDVAAKSPRFEQALHRSMRDGEAQTPGREAAEELVAVSFIEPLMKMARNDPFKSELFHGGQGEEAFGGQLDQQLARGMIDGMNLPLVDAVQDQLTAGFGKGVDRHG